MKKIAFISAGAVIVLGLAAIVALGGAFGGPLRAQAAGEASPLAATITVTSLADAGTGTLRQALLDALPGDTINFGKNGVIALASPLPTIITDNLTIDASGRNVLISGSNTVTGTCGLVITSSQVTVRSLQIVQFDKVEPPYSASCGIAIFGTEALSNTIAGNYIGTDKNSSTGIGNSDGIVIVEGARWNTVGGTGASDRNIVSGNSYVGVIIVMTGTMYNKVVGNYIGTNVAGTAVLPNRWGVVLMDGAGENTIGAIPAAQSNVAARQMAARGNLISGNSDSGLIVHRSMSNTIAGNWFGLNAAGTAVLSGSLHGHISVGEGSQYNVIRNNVIVGNETSCPPCRNGIGMGADNAMYNRIMYNRIGIGPNNQPMPNFDGIRIDVWPGNSVGPQKNTIGPGNIIAFNAATGVSMSGTLVLSNTITQNSIYSNTHDGIYQEYGANREPTLIPTITITDGNCVVQGTACPNCVVEIFSDYDDEGRWYEGTITATASGNFTYSLGFRGPKVTATATDPAGNTSEFSTEREGTCRRVLAPVIMNNSVISP